MAVKTSGPETRLQKVRSRDCRRVQACRSSTTGCVSSFQKPRTLRRCRPLQAARWCTVSLPSLRQPLKSTTFKDSAQPAARASIGGESTRWQSAILSVDRRGRECAKSWRHTPSSLSSALLVSRCSSLGAKRPRRQPKASSSRSGTLRRTTAVGYGSARSGTSARMSFELRLEASCRGSSSSWSPLASSRRTSPYSSRRFFMLNRKRARSSGAKRGSSWARGRRHSSRLTQISTRPLGRCSTRKACRHRGHRRSLPCSAANCSSFCTHAGHSPWPHGESFWRSHCW
mmetsp:Transcript_6995/g.21228  ORF Transcript_6995/g.21228 Transcript_6995/m.21228 type:complete len:286 (+) Transcript_6995:1165-2022(+)